jgi:hypothetical protein
MLSFKLSLSFNGDFQVYSLRNSFNAKILG